MSFNAIIGQDKAKTILQNGLRERKISHAYLFAGPSGSGKKQMAWAFVQSLLCDERTDEACGHCVQCRKVLHGNHPNIQYIEPEGSSIKIEQIRQLQRHFTYRGDTANTRIYLIDQADRMTVPAANSLLKFLEDPMPEIIAVLLTNNEQMLLPTIRSRVMWVPFFSMAPEQMRKVLLLEEGSSAEIVGTAIHLRSGLDGVRELIQFQAFAEIRNVVIQLGKDLFKGPAAASLFIQQHVIKGNWQDALELFLDMLALWLKDMVHMLAGRAEKVVFEDHAEENRKLAYSRPIASWIHDIDCTLEARKRLRYHTNPQLVLEQLLFRIQEG